MAFPIPSSGLAVIGPRLWSLRLFYQQPGGPIGQAVHVDGAWSQAPSTFSAVPLSPLAAITWNTGKEIRAYYLDEQYIVQEYCFTEGHGWYKGQTGELKAKASPQSRLGAIIYHHEGHNHIRVYYQEDKTHVVRELAYDGKWHMGEMQIKNAIEGTGIASVTYIANAQRQIRVYYQSPDLLLREYCHNNKGWFAGEFNPGKAPAQAPLGALATVNAHLRVFWRDETDHISYRKHAGKWEPTVVIKEVTPGFGFTVLEWELGKHLRLYYEDYKNLLYEVYSDDGGSTWHAGHKLSGK